MRRVVIESPYGSTDPRVVAENVAFARACMADCLKRGEAPYASHLLLTQKGILNDSDPNERALGIMAGLVWGESADLVAVYTDRGISSGMKQGIKAAQASGTPIEYRTLWERLLEGVNYEPCNGR
jgi:hypothetical protein